MAITATARGTGSDNSSSTSINVAASLTGTMAAGSTGILAISMDNANGATGNLSATSYTDSKLNIWYVRTTGIGGAAFANAEGAILSAYLAASLASSDTLTITLTASAPTSIKTWAFIEASTNVTGAQVLYNAFASWGSVATTGTPSINTTQFPGNGELLVGVGAAESTDTWVGDTVNTTGGAWSTKQSTGVNGGTTATSVAIITQWKIPTVYGTQTWAPTLTSADVKLGLVTFTECDVRARGAGGNAASETTTLLPIQRSMAAGSIAILCLAGDNNGSGGTNANIATTPTDSKSNTWTQRQTKIYSPGVAGSGTETAIYTTGLNGGALVQGDNITVTWGIAVSSKAFVVLEIAPTVGGSAMTYVTGSNSQAGSSSASPSMTTGSSITSGDYIVGMWGLEAIDNMTGDSGTTNGTWGPLSTAAKGATLAAGQTVAAQIKKVTATATQTYAITSGGGAVDCVPLWIEINDASVVGGISAKQKASFFQMF